MPLQIRRNQFRHPFGYELAAPNERVVIEILEYLFNTTAWKTNPDALKRKVRLWRENLFAVGAPTAGPDIFVDDAPAVAPAIVETPAEPTPPAEEDEVDWVEQAVSLKLQGMGWTKIADTLKRPRATVRRVVGAEFTQRGLEVPVGAE